MDIEQLSSASRESIVSHSSALRDLIGHVESAARENRRSVHDGRNGQRDLDTLDELRLIPEESMNDVFTVNVPTETMEMTGDTLQIDI